MPMIDNAPKENQHMNHTFHARLGAVLSTGGCGLLCLIIAFGNITDYGTNFEFVKHVLSMDTIFPNSAVTYRALTQPAFHHIAYIIIILLEASMAFFLLKGTFDILKAIHAESIPFQASKKNAYIGICLGIILWFIGFIVVGGEWFSMWQSQTWNGLGSADRIITFFMLTYTVLLVTK
jgi:predicted small integral membrane protein